MIGQGEPPPNEVLQDFGHDPDEVEAQADELLSQGRYDYADDESSSFLDRVSETIDDFLEWLFGGADQAGGAGGDASMSWLGWLFILLLLGALGFVIFWAIRSGVFSRRLGRSVDDDVVIEAVPGRSAENWLDEAVRHEDAGEWRKGLLCRYRSLVVELADREVVDEVAGLTSGELQRLVTEAVPALGAPFGRATELFEDVWYGGAPAGPSERDRFVAEAERTVATSRRATPAGVSGPLSVGAPGHAGEHGPDQGEVGR